VGLLAARTSRRSSMAGGSIAVTGGGRAPATRSDAAPSPARQRGRRRDDQDALLGVVGVVERAQLGLLMRVMSDIAMMGQR
jgi:hypothetical protein